MATKTPKTTRTHRRPAAKDASLIDWIEPDRNVRVLDWRERAQQFGLVPVGAENDAEDDALPSGEHLTGAPAPGGGARGTV